MFWSPKEKYVSTLGPNSYASRCIYVPNMNKIQQSYLSEPPEDDHLRPKHLNKNWIYNQELFCRRTVNLTINTQQDASLKTGHCCVCKNGPSKDRREENNGRKEWDGEKVKKRQRLYVMPRRKYEYNIKMNFTEIFYKVVNWFQLNQCNGLLSWTRAINFWIPVS